MGHQTHDTSVPPFAVVDPSLTKHMELVRPIAPDDRGEGERSRIVFAPMNLAHFNHEDRNVAIFPQEGLQGLSIVVEIDLCSLTQLTINPVVAERPFLPAIVIVKAPNRPAKTHSQFAV